jgi:hypothetical protein
MELTRLNLTSVSHARSMALSSTCARLWRVYTFRGRWLCFREGMSRGWNFALGVFLSIYMRMCVRMCVEPIAR